MQKDKHLTLYKYRGGDELIFKRDLESLVNDCYWSAEIPSLNDPCEALINSEGYFESLKALDKAVHSAISSEIDFQVIRAKMNELLTKALTVGVFSLSRNFTDELMWSHYASAHHGFCIAYDMYYMERSLKKYFYNLLEVVYAETPPEIKMMEQIMSREPEMGMKQLLATKSLKWKNEEEVRIITDKPGLHYYDYRAVASIYFGLRMKDEQKEQLMFALKGRGIKYFQMQMASKAYSFLPFPVEDKYLSAPKYMYKVAPVMPGAEDISGVQEHFRKHSGYLNKAIEVARREPYCIKVITSGFSFTCPIERPVIFVHCQRSDIEYGNFEYSLGELDALYNSIEDLKADN
jgi:hypothetical protein